MAEHIVMQSLELRLLIEETLQLQRIIRRVSADIMYPIMVVDSLVLEPMLLRLETNGIKLLEMVAMYITPIVFHLCQTWKQTPAQLRLLKPSISRIFRLTSLSRAIMVRTIPGMFGNRRIAPSLHQVMFLLWTLCEKKIPFSMLSGMDPESLFICTIIWNRFLANLEI